MALLVSLFLAMPALAMADRGKPDTGCSASIEPSTRLVRLIYDPFETDLSPYSLELVVRKQGGERCQFAITVEGDGDRWQRFLSNGGVRLGYELSRAGRVLENQFDTPRAAEPLQAGKDGEGRFELRFRIRDGEFVPSGEYTDQLKVRLFRLGDGAPRQVGTETVIMVSALVPARAQLNVAGADTQVFGANPAGAIDFGDLITGASRQVFVQVRATSPVLLRLSSAERGQLRHSTFGNKVRGVPYSATLSGAELALQSGPVGLARSPSAGAVENYPLRFSITDAEGRTGGIYQDVVTISVEPR
jgi:hypothetical protein